jgi:putative restriction endonuclease
MNTAEDYCSKFRKLHPNRIRNDAGQIISAPHKPALLLSVIDLIGKRVITQNEIILSDISKFSFEEQWDNFITESQKEVGYKPDIKKPFYHLKNLGKPYQNEPFWHHEPEIFDFRNLKKVQYAYLDEELFEILKDKNARGRLIDVLRESYFSEKVYF